MDYYNLIKNELVENEINKRIKDYSKNKYELEKYYNVGKLLYDAGKHYGEGIINKYSVKLSKEINSKYNITNLKRIRQFYIMIEKGATLWHQLSWSHYRLLIPLKSIDIINYYSTKVINESLSVRDLDRKIKSKEYERLPESTKIKLNTNKETNIIDIVKEPIKIKNNIKIKRITEKILQKLIMENIATFLEELGDGFTYVGNEYKIKIGNTYNYIDLLLFNYKYNCFVVIELKVTELKKEHVGQIQVYMNYIDDNLRNYTQEKTIGIIICKHNNQYVIRYCSDKRIISREYELV